MEVYLLHPAFALSVRNYVLGRLQAWCQRGFRGTYREEFRDGASNITDSHIVENLLLKTLESHLGSQFASRYLLGQRLGSGADSAPVGAGTGTVVYTSSLDAINNNRYFRIRRTVQFKDGITSSTFRFSFIYESHS